MKGFFAGEVADNIITGIDVVDVVAAAHGVAAIEGANIPIVATAQHVVRRTPPGFVVTILAAVAVIAVAITRLRA